MTEAIGQSGLPTAAGPQGGLGGWLRANKHFVVAASILAFATAAWFIAIQTKLIFPVKRPVPWAVGQQIGEDGRWLNLATRFGPFRRVETADETAIEQIGPGGGETVYSEEILESLGISGRLGQKELAERSSNWYVSRRYLDERKLVHNRLNGAYALWYLDLTYYTGSVDRVPHTPMACLVAGGRVVTGQKEISVHVTVPERWKPWWDGTIAINRVTSESARGPRNRAVDYYFFCLNGEPETDRLVVRRRLTYPWVPHCYFAKIQFGPRTNVEIDDIKTADQAAEEFVRCFLPEVLQGMPTPDDVKKLKTVK